MKGRILVAMVVAVVACVWAAEGWGGVTRRVGTVKSIGHTQAGCYFDFALGGIGGQVIEVHSYGYHYLCSDIYLAKALCLTKVAILFEADSGGKLVLAVSELNEAVPCACAGEGSACLEWGTGRGLAPTQDSVIKVAPEEVPAVIREID